MYAVCMALKTWNRQKTRIKQRYPTKRENKGKKQGTAVGTHRLHLALPQAHGRGAQTPLPSGVDEAGGDGAVDAAAAHVDDDDKLDARVGLVAVGGQALVDGVQQAKVAAEAYSAGGIVAGAQLKDVEGARQQEGELEGVPDGGEGVGGRVVGREDGDVEGVVLGHKVARSVKTQGRGAWSRPRPDPCMQEVKRATHVAPDDAQAGYRRDCCRHWRPDALEARLLVVKRPTVWLMALVFGAGRVGVGVGVGVAGDATGDGGPPYRDLIR